jgi:glycosyltransferase involved in cell wall biosynthesis
LPDLPRPEHAAFYHCAAVTVHPAIFEGGAMAFPFQESVSVGTPCLVARGPHIDECLEMFPELQPWVFDPESPDALADLIRDTIHDRDQVLDQQMKIYDRMGQRGWGDVVGEFADFVAAARRNEPAVGEQR